MRAQQATARQGAEWFLGGWQLFRRQPWVVASLVLSTLMILAMLGWLSWLGGALGLILMPFLSFCFLEIGRQLSQLEPAPSATPVSKLHLALFKHLRSVVQDPINRRHFLALGVAYLLAVLLVVGLSALADGGTLARMTLLGEPIQAKEIESAELLAPLVILTLGYVPISMAFWYAPGLLVWERMPPGKALFYSVIAVWRNKVAFMLYGLVAIGWFMLAQICALFCLTLLGENFGGLVLMPLGLALVATGLCSFYPTYVDVFGAPALRESDFPQHD